MKRKKILGICGTQKKHGKSSSEFLLKEALKAAENEGAETRLVKLVDYNIIPCDGCGKCMAKEHCYLLSYPEDQLNELYAECVWADAFIFSSPVYALGLPAIWKTWIDRCEPCTDQNLDYEYYCYDTVQGVKGKAFRGKVAGQIYVAAGPGHEWALSSLMPAFTAIKLSIVASVGLSLIEYDGQPGIKKQPWAKDIKDAQFAVDMARAVGRRVYETIGYSTFKIDNINRAIVNNNDKTKSLDFTLFDRNDFGVNLSRFDIPFLMLISSQRQYADKSQFWLDKFMGIYKNHVFLKIINLVQVEKLPHFIKKEDIKNHVLSDGNRGYDFLFDWDMNFSSKYNLINDQYPIVMIINCRESKLKFSEVLNDIQGSIEPLIEKINQTII